MAIITIDGPAGAGKSTVAKKLAEHLGFVHFDTGAIYRSLAYWAQSQNVPIEDEDRCAELGKNLPLEFHSGKVFVHQIDVSMLIRTPEISMAASQIAKLPKVRAALLEYQQAFGRLNSIVVEGRDTGTVVYPMAEVKFFITADLHARAQRRFDELKTKGHHSVTFESVLDEARIRDEQDSQRSVAPLKPATDAILVDTSHLGIDDVVQLLEQKVRARLQL